jgi:hypothetical protein
MASRCGLQRCGLMPLSGFLGSLVPCTDEHVSFGRRLMQGEQNVLRHEPPRLVPGCPRKNSRVLSRGHRARQRGKSSRHPARGDQGTTHRWQDSRQGGATCCASVPPMYSALGHRALFLVSCEMTLFASLISCAQHEPRSAHSHPAERRRTVPQRDPGHLWRQPRSGRDFRIDVRPPPVLWQEAPSSARPADSLTRSQRPAQNFSRAQDRRRQRAQDLGNRGGVVWPAVKGSHEILPIYLAC